MATIAVLGTLDTKGREHAFVAEKIRSRGHRPLLIDVGTGEPPTVVPDIFREDVAKAAAVDLAKLIAERDRGACVSAMAKAAPRPIGFPKLIVSTLASGNTAHSVGTKDIVMMPAVVDVQGLNRISRTILARAAGAICGMVEADVAGGNEKPLIVASMFGNTTKCIEAAVPILERAGYEVLVFPATGTGGRAMEALIESGLVAGVLDVTTTELADELVGGVLTAGPTRLDAAAKLGVPAIVVPGCLDMVNFGERPSVPEKFRGRTFYVHNPQVTLMRTTAAECAELGRIVATKVNAYSAAVTVLIPRGGISVISGPGGPFHDPEADAALFAQLEQIISSILSAKKTRFAVDGAEKECAVSVLKSHVANGLV